MRATPGPARRRRDPGATLRQTRLPVRNARSLKLGLAMAILLISSELPEVMNLSRRLLVMRGGRIVGEFQRSEFQQAAILNRMVGH